MPTPSAEEFDAAVVATDILRETLRAEHALRTSTTSPWKCASKNCPYWNKPMPKSCGCFRERLLIHCRLVRALMLED